MILLNTSSAIQDLSALLERIDILLLRPGIKTKDMVNMTLSLVVDYK